MIGSVFQEWLERQGGHMELPNSLLGEAMDILQETNSNEVPEIAKALPQFPPVLLARFRNGDLEAGIQFCNNDMGGSPNTNNPQRDSVFEDAIQRWGDQYADALSDALSSIATEHVQGALYLAGFIGRSELKPGLEDCWEEYQDNPNLLPAFLWATFQCCIPKHSSLVDEVLNQWTSLPSGNSIDDTDVEFGKGDLFRTVKFSLTKDISEPQTQYLIEAMDEFPDLEYHLSLLLNKIPDPDALELVVRKRGENMEEIDGLSPWATHLLDPWRPDSPRGQTLPPEGKERMEDIWTNDDNSDETRTSAFQLWARNAQAGDIGKLKRASNNDLFTYTANYYRLQLGDETVIRSSSLDMIKNPGLLEVLSSAWCNDAYEVVDEVLSQCSLDEAGDLSYHLGELLFRIPQDDAEKLLETHWGKVNSHPKFFQAALYTATPLTRELAKSAYADSDAPSALLNHIGMNFGFKTYGRSELIDKEHLYSLEPYLDDLSEMDLIEVAEKAKEVGLEDWGAEHIQPLLSEDARQNYYPTDDDICRELNDIEDSEDIEREIRGWMMRFDNQTKSKSRVFQVLEEWLRSSPTVEKYQIAAEIIKNWGTRSEMSILDDISLNDDRVQQIYRDVEFGVQVRSLN
jgi:hypothetical protein